MRLIVPIALAACALASSSDAADAPLPKLKLDAARTTVSGLSSGAYMAHQVHVAFSDHIAGAAMIAGGPYHCAQDSLEIALGSCMMPAEDKKPDVTKLVSFARMRAKDGAISPLSGLSGDKVLILHGRQDKTVAEALSTATASLYREAMAPVTEVHVREDIARDFTHTFPTESSGASCETSTAPYVGKCGFDAAGEIFSDLYGKPAHAVAAPTGELRTFDQDAFRTKDTDAYMASKGYVYVPKDCAAGKKTCALHIAFHGCSQSADAVGEAFVRDAGYNRWADAYDVVVLYPQARASMAPLNPKGCWDWWGYSGQNYDTRDGLQMQMVSRMSAALGAPLR